MENRDCQGFIHRVEWRGADVAIKHSRKDPYGDGGICTLLLVSVSWCDAYGLQDVSSGENGLKGKWNLSIMFYNCISGTIILIKS